MLNQEDAEDLSQEVFVEIFLSIVDFKGQSKLSTWIYRIAVGKCLDEIKKRNRKKRITQFSRFLGIDFISQTMAGGLRPDDTLENTESLGQLTAALESLPKNQRIALTLSKLDNHSNSEVAEIMNISVTAADSLIYRAKQNLLHFFTKTAPDKRIKGV